jgi:hypothetical protein
MAHASVHAIAPMWWNIHEQTHVSMQCVFKNRIEYCPVFKSKKASIFRLQFTPDYIEHPARMPHS